MKTIREDPGDAPVSTRTILMGLLLIAIGAMLELFNEIVLQGAFQSSTDPLPAYISSLDVQIFIWINNYLSNTYLAWVLNIFTRLGSTFSMFVIGILLYVSRRRRESMLILASIIIGTVIALPLKLIVPRPRPFVTVPTAVFFDREAGSSFPSGHTMRVFAFGLIASKLRPRLAVPLQLFACLVAFSRIYVGQHYPLDVLAGALIGLLVGCLTLRYERRIAEAVSRLRRSTTPKTPERSSIRLSRRRPAHPIPCLEAPERRSCGLHIA